MISILFLSQYPELFKHKINPKSFAYVAFELSLIHLQLLYQEFIDGNHALLLDCAV